MRDIIEFTLTVIASTVIGFTSHVWYIENIHTQDSGESIPLASVVKSPESFIETTYRCSAYCPCQKCCASWAKKGVNSKGQKITASGHVICPGDAFVAAPKNIPFGTLLIVPGYNDGKPVKVFDRGGAITAGRLDVYFSTHKAALKWGVRNVAVSIKIKLGN
ncbi:MAG TPA: 3D domain-containing protein [Sedimentisphaerales bacterium]|nr:3D domain-containing protein [Sedimentisphaerales bacterium]HUU15587.1 3D domain-containing protein [Sedimentisphaerales bacterium]